MKIPKPNTKLYKLDEFYNYYCCKEGHLYTLSYGIHWSKREWRKNYLFEEQLYAPLAENKKKVKLVKRKDIIEKWRKLNDDDAYLHTSYA